MTEQTKTRLTNGTALCHGNLIILVKDRNPDLAETLMGDTITPEIKQQYKQEINRLQNLMEHIVDSYPDRLDIFQCLPLTKAGKFNNAQNTLIADSKCTTANLFPGERTMYPEKRTVQLRLMPYYDSEDAFIRNQKMENVRELRLDWYDAIRKTTPVFDVDENPSAPKTTRMSYLKDTDIKPGFVYEEKSGTQFLVLEGMQFGARYIYQQQDENPHGTRVIWYGMTNHVYVRWTKKLESALSGTSDFNTFCHIMADSSKDSPWTFRSDVSVRDNPRKFVKEICQVLNPSLTRTEQFMTMPDTSPAARQDQKKWFEYFLFQGNQIPADMLVSEEYNSNDQPL